MATARKRTTDKPDDVEPAAKRQHPAVVGEKALEVAKRTADGPDGEHGLTFYKTFRVRLPGDEPSDALVNVNRIRVVEEAIQRGLHPTAEPTHTGSEVVERHRRGAVTVDLHYTVPVEPAVTDDTPAESVAPSDLAPAG